MNTSQKNDQAVHYLQSTAYPAGKIAIRYKFPKGPTNKVVLILHGATLPSFIFDLPPSPTQPSMMSYLADKGYAVYSIDFRGYGLSSKPAAMDDPSMSGLPIMNHKDAAVDVQDAVDFIQKQHPNISIVLCGFSWGSSISGYIASQQDWVSKLILLGPVYSYPNPQWKELADPGDQTRLNPGIKSYRLASRERWCGLWNRELEGKNLNQYRNPKTLGLLLDHIENTDIKWAQENQKSGYIRLSTGVLSDALRTFNQNPIYDASKISCPTFVLRGELDTASLSADADGLMKKLTCPKKRVDIKDATHYGILELGAERFFQAITDFIENN